MSANEVKLADLHIQELGEFVYAFLQPGGSGPCIEIARLRADLCRSDEYLATAFVDLMRKWLIASSRRVAGLRPISVEQHRSPIQ